MHADNYASRNVASIHGLVASAEKSAYVAAKHGVVLVDVRMPRMDGLEFAQHAARLAAPPGIIFTTAYDHYAVQAFDISAVDYLLKPIRAQRLLQALQKVTTRSGATDGNSRDDVPPSAHLNPNARSYLSCHERGKLLLIPVADVLYLRADTKYVMARTVEREYLLNDSLLALEAEFGERFLRLHRSVLAAKSALIGFEKAHSTEGDHWVALLKGIPDRLPVSRRHWPVVKDFARQLAGE